MTTQSATVPDGVAPSALPERMPVEVTPLRVLIIEDDRDDAMLSMSALRRAPGLDCIVTVRENMHDAVAYLDESDVDVALLDLSLPDAEDMQAVSRLANRFHRLPVVVLTGRADERAAARALRMGAEDYLVKGGSDPGEMARALRHAIARKKAEHAQVAREWAEAAHKEKNLFVYRLSAGLRTPLSEILRCAGELGDTPDLPGRAQVGDILRHSRRLARLVDSLIDISRIEAGELALDLEAVQVSGAVAGAVDWARPRAQARGLRLEVNLDGVEHARVVADPQRFRQVLDILLANAVDYNREAGSITVAAHESAAGYLRLDVCDTGIGMNAEQVARLYTPFNRDVDQAVGEGTGLSLYIAKRLTEAMGGHLWHDSGPERGTSGRTEWLILDHGRRMP